MIHLNAAFAGVCLGLALIGAGERLQADALPPIAPDRPGFTNGSDVVPVGYTHVEAGVEYTTVPDSAGGGHVVDAPEALVRHGVTPNLEWRLALPDRYSSNTGGSGWGDAAVGVKWKFYQSKSGSTKMALFPMLSVPSHDSRYSSGQVDPSLLIGAQTASGSRWGLSANLGLSDPTQNGTRNATIAPSAAVQYQLTPTLSTYVDAIDSVPKTGPTTPIADGGFIVVPANNIQYDVEMGIGLGGDAPVRYYGGGVAVRF